MNKPVDKDSLQLNQPKRTPGHPTKSHIVKTKVDGKEKIIRFGQQGASTAGKPKEGESDRMTAKRASFKARHSANIAKGPSSAAYWANKVKWADGGSVRTNYADGDSVQATPQSPALGSIANFLKQSYSPERTQQMQGMAEFFDIPALARTVERMSYGEPITNVGKANVPILPDDTAAAAMLVGPMGGPLAKYAKRVGTNLVQTAPFVARDIAKSMTAPTRSYVIKPEAGNWLANSVESTIGSLKTGTFDEAGLRSLAERQGADIAENVRIRQEPSVALNKWIDQKVNKYIKNEMATPSDRLRLLADEGISHIQLNPNRSVYGYIPLAREKAGFPKEGLAKTPLGKQWENKADELITNQPAGVRLEQSSQNLIDNPWLAKVPPETDVYSLGGPYGVSEKTRSLGFNHLIDELGNAIDPESTLPANLRLTSKQLNDVTMPDAVKLVSKINDWRAKEAAKAELAGMTDNLMAVPRLQDPTAQLSFVKEPGMTWVDIPATTDKKAKKLCTTIGKQAGWCTQGDSLAETYGSGNNRLTTLLDADGRPHAQAKISSIPQSGDIMEDIDDLLGSMSAAERRKFNNFLGSDDFYGEQEEALEWLQTNMPKAYDRYIASVSGPPSIGEIKPVGNYFDSERALEYEKRDPQYRAKITDSVVKFLNSGEWSQVNDLDIYDIVDTKDPTTIKKFIKVNHMTADSSSVQKDFSKNYNGERFVKAEKFDDLINDYIPRTGGYDGYAAGGSVSVYDPNKIDEIMNSFDQPQGYAEGGPVHMGKGGDVEDTLDTFVAPSYRKQRATPSSEKTKAKVAEAAQFAADMVIPQTPFDVALTLLPFGKPGKALAAGILAGSPAEAQAGNMSALLKLVAKEAPEQFQSIRNALLRTYHSGLEHSVVGSTRIGGPSEVIQGTISSATPNKLDLKAARKNIDKSPLIDFHTHPSQTTSRSEFKVRPSDTDLKFWMGQYGSSYAPELPNEVRLMVGTPANKGERTTGAYNFFATDKPAQTLNPKTYEAAKYELQRSKPLQSIKDNSLVGMYLDSGGDLGDLLDSASPLLLQKYFAQKGLGRHEMQLSNRPVTSPSVTEQELFNQIANPAIEIIKSKRFESFAKGGSVTAYDPDQVDAIANQYM